MTGKGTSIRVLTHFLPNISDKGAQTRGLMAKESRNIDKVKATSVSLEIWNWALMSGKAGAIIELTIAAAIVYIETYQGARTHT